jgi:hypothetical protein
LLGKGFIATPQEIDKYMPIQLEAVQIWTTCASYFAHVFFQKSFLDTQVPISS